MSEPRPGKVVVISGPSGAGKTTVVSRLVAECPLPLVRSVSATTRAPRPGEREGINYRFLAHEEFARRRAAGDFLECFEVFGSGHWYGTLRSEVAPRLAAGEWVVLEIDVQGAISVMESFPDAVTIFVRPRSLEELERRLRGRQTESEETIRRRLETARHELSLVHRYRYEVINDSVDDCVREMCDILRRSGE
jgi:guanylate kinase